MSGIKFMGKDPNGLAKAISVNDDGVLLVELLGSLLIGEVAENPTANTILGRMKSLESKIDTLGVVIDSILAKMIDSPATEAKQAALEALVGTLTDTAVNDPTASGTIIALLKGLITQMQGDGASGKSMPVSLSGSIETVNDNPVTGIKTVTAIAAEIFAGGSAKTNRRKLIVRNEDQSLRLRIGKSDVTQQNGYPVEPGATVEFQFDPNVAVPIYAISEGANLKVAVMEI